MTKYVVIRYWIFSHINAFGLKITFCFNNKAVFNKLSLARTLQHGYFEKDTMTKLIKRYKILFHQTHFLI